MLPHLIIPNGLVVPLGICNDLVLFLAESYLVNGFENGFASGYPFVSRPSLYGIRRELDREGLRADKLEGVWQFDGCIPVAIVTDYRAYSLTSR